MRQEIETAPTDGEFVLLEDDAGGKLCRRALVC